MCHAQLYLIDSTPPTISPVEIRYKTYTKAVGKNLVLFEMKF